MSDSDISEGELRRRLRRTINSEFYDFTNDNSNTSSSSDVEMDQGEISDNEVEDPQYPYEEEISRFENDHLIISYKRIQFRKLERFNLTDYNFSLSIKYKSPWKLKNILLSTALMAILDGMRDIFEAMKNDFNHNLDRNMYITLKHPDLPTPIVLGPLNFENDRIEDIIDKINVKISYVLESHKTLKVDTNMMIFARVLGIVSK